MANGVLCKICGYQEADHVGGLRMHFADDETFEKKHPKLVNCSGYVPLTKNGYEKPPGKSWENEDFD